MNKKEKLDPKTLQEVGLGTIHDQTTQQPVNSENKPLYGEEAILNDIPRLKRIMGWSGLKIDQILNYLKTFKNSHTDELIEAANRIKDEEKKS